MDLARTYPGWFWSLTEWLEIPGTLRLIPASFLGGEGLDEMILRSPSQPKLLYEISKYWESPCGTSALEIF